MTAVGVFCGARCGTRPAYADAARAVGRLLARRGVTVVYGGGNVGLMGALADAALDEGGTVVGVIPRDMIRRELAHRGLHELIVVETMAQRKDAIASRSDAFIALPGGVGTLDELFEMVTWNQLAFHAKPCALLNTEGFYDPLHAWLARCRDERLVLEHTMDLLLIDDDPRRLIDRVLTLIGGP